MKKENYTYIWVSLVILVFGIIFIPKIINRVQRGDIVENNRMSEENDPDRLAYITLNGERRRVPDFALINQDSLLITNEDYEGKVYVAEFFFTSCPSICPIMNRNLVGLQDEFREFENFGVASFTIDPEQDTPSVLKAYAENYGIDDMDWHLLTGDRDTIFRLANEGFNIFAAEVADVPGGFEHSGLFALIDQDGYLRSRRDPYGNPIVYYRGAISEEQGHNHQGETEQVSLLKEDIRKLLEENKK